MDFIKKQIEKLLLALVLLTLIAVAAFFAFKVNTLSQQVSGAAWRPKPTGKLVQPIDMTRYSNSIARLQTPSLWHTNPINPFQQEISRVISNPFPTGPITNVEPFSLVAITRKPFQLMFKAYIGKGENFQVDFITHRRTFFVPKVGDKIADRFGDTGYVVTKFVLKEEIIDVPGVGKRPVDVSELTIQAGNQPPIVLILNRITEEKEPEAKIVCSADNQNIVGRAGDNQNPFNRVGDNQTIVVRKDQQFKCGGKTYKVVDITLTQVIIVEEETQEKHTINLPGAKE